MVITDSSPEFEALLQYLKHHQGHDLTGYKRSSLTRRLGHRMESIGIDNYRRYLQYLETHPEEPQALLEDVFINFTGFFRDLDFWNALETDFIPKMLAQKTPGTPIRVWSAGCAYGQEIYSLVMLFAEAIGIDRCLHAIKCYATDIDKNAIQRAASGTYNPLEVENLPPNLLQKYFQPTNSGYVFHPGLRRQIVFGHHNLVNDPPIPHIDLLICRNVFIYFNSDVQRAVLSRFHFALKDTGFLALGAAEATHNHPCFKTINHPQRIYAKGASLALDDLLMILPEAF